MTYGAYYKDNLKEKSKNKIQNFVILDKITNFKKCGRSKQKCEYKDLVSREVYVNSDGGERGG